MFRTIRNQIALIISIFCILIVVGFMLMRISNQQKIDLLVSGMQSEKAILLEKVIEFKSKDLLAFSYDYTYWDDMVSFVKNVDPQWAEENIAASIPTFNIDYVWIYQPDLSLIYSTTSKENKPLLNLPVNKEILESISKSEKLQHFYISTNEGLIEISMATIHPTIDKERKTPVQGYFFAGRLWTKSYLEEVGLLTESEIQLVRSDMNSSPDSNQKYDKFSLVNSLPLKGFDNSPVATIISTSNIHFFEVLTSRIDQRFVWGAAFTFLFLIFFLTFFAFRLYRPLHLLSKSLEDENPEFIKDFIEQKGEFGQLSLLITNFFSQKDKLVKEINERKLVEKQLKKLSVATEQSPAIIIITSIDGNIEYVNPKFTEVTGYYFDEVIGKNPRLLKSGNKSDEDYKELWNTILSGKEWHGELINKKKSGEIFYESAQISAITDEKGNIVNLLAVKEDITARKRDEAIQNILFKISKAGSESKNLDELINQISISLGELIDVSNFYLALYDEQTDTFTLPHFQDQKDVISTFKAAKTLTAYVLKSKKSFFGTRDKIDKLRAKGVVESLGEPAKIWLGVPLMIDNIAFGVFVVQSYDNEKAFSEEDKEMLEFISNEISHIIIRKKADEEIRIALEKAEGSDRLKSAFLANMSHEIRTPLNSILGFIELLNDPEIGPEHQEEFSLIIKNSAKQLLSIINDILDFSMIEAGQIRIVKTTFMIEKVIREIYNEFLPEAQGKGLEFKIDPRILHSETTIETDFSRLRQICSNLVNNALKFTRSGNIEIGFSTNREGFLFYVKDTGIGIPNDFKNYVFERFQQAERSKSRNYGGNGLGLAISKNLVDLMGGKIWFESEVGKGTVFYFLLPG